MGSGPRPNRSGERTLPTRAPISESMGHKGDEPSMTRSGGLGRDRTPGVNNSQFESGSGQHVDAHHAASIPSRYNAHWANDGFEDNSENGDKHLEDKSLPPRAGKAIPKGLDPSTTSRAAGGQGAGQLGDDKGDYAHHGMHPLVHAQMLAHALRNMQPHMKPTAKEEGGDGG
jgi:hypothetical protein